MIDNIVYAKLSGDATLTGLVGSEIRPVLPDVDQALPYVYYWRYETQDTLTMSGPIRPKQYVFAFDYWSQTQAQCRAISEAIYNLLSTWRDADVQGAFLQGDAMQIEERGFHGQSLFQIWS